MRENASALNIICKVCSTPYDLFDHNNTYMFFRCPNCAFWDARYTDGREIYTDYTDYKIGNDSFIVDDRASRVLEAKKILKNKFDLIEKFEPKTFLDIGCSEGFYVEAARDLNIDAWGIDVPSKNNDRCKYLGLNVLSTSEWNLLDNKRFDFILLRHTVEHIPEFIPLIRRAKKLLSNKGILCIEVPNQDGLLIKLTRNNITGGRFLRHLYPPSHVNAFEKTTFKYLAISVELQLILLKTYSQSSKFWWMGEYSGGIIKKSIHNVTAALGMGESIVAMYSKVED